MISKGGGDRVSFLPILSLRLSNELLSLDLDIVFYKRISYPLYWFSTVFVEGQLFTILWSHCRRVMLQIFLSHLIWSPPMMPPSTSAWYYATQHQWTDGASQEDHPGISGHNQEQTFSEVNPCSFNKSWTYCVKVFAVSVFVVKIWWWDKMYLSSVGWFSGSPARHSWHFWNGGALSRTSHSVHSRLFLPTPSWTRQ